MGIVTVWITTGTLFYSYCNDWPLPQSFFYAVDAGMSVGFCTQVHETKLISKAFSILFILLGASVIGGALALFIQDAMEGLAFPATEEYQVLLERHVFEKADLNKTGTLAFDQFQALIRTSLKDQSISNEDMQLLWKRFDRLKDGVIHFEEFVGSFRGFEGLVQTIQQQQQNVPNPLRRMLTRIQHLWKQAWHIEYRPNLYSFLSMGGHGDLVGNAGSRMGSHYRHSLCCFSIGDGRPHRAPSKCRRYFPGTSQHLLLIGNSTLCPDSGALCESARVGSHCRTRTGRLGSPHVGGRL